MGAYAAETQVASIDVLEQLLREMGVSTATTRDPNRNDLFFVSCTFGTATVELFVDLEAMRVPAMCIFFKHPKGGSRAERQALLDAVTSLHDPSWREANHHRIL